MSEKEDISVDVSGFDPERDSDLLAEAEDTVNRVYERLREAVKGAGGATAVASKSGVNSRTLSRLLAGQEPKTGTLVALARATNVSLDWLMTGQGERQPRGFGDVPPPLTPPAAPPGYITLELSDISALYELAKRCGGIEPLAGFLKVDPAELRALIGGGRASVGTVKATERLLRLPPLDVPAAAESPPPPPAVPATPAAPASNAGAPTSIADLVDFNALVACLELAEDVDRLGGGQLKSARSRLRRAFYAYDIQKSDKD